jgi:hypothetical protein
VSIAAEPTQWDRIFDLLSDGEWRTEKELATITRYPRQWIHELGESGYLLERDADGRVRLLTAGRPSG